MLADLAGGRTHELRLARYTRPELLVVDDVGLNPLHAPGGDLYDVINERPLTLGQKPSFLVAGRPMPSPGP
jgi:hypothetical protein